MWLITVSVFGRPSGTDVSQTNYTLSNLSSATVIRVVSVVRMLLFSGGSASVILALPIHNLLNRQDQPECSHCDSPLTVAHVLLECNHYNVVRQRYFNVSSLHYCSTRSMPKIFLVLLEILGFIVSCNLTFSHLIDFITTIVFKPIVNI